MLRTLPRRTRAHPIRSRGHTPSSAYEAWLRTQPGGGYVVNARQRITPAYPKLHTT
jgi:hypothetical protein